MYSTRTRVHARIPNGHPREENRACRTSRRTSRRGSSCVSGSWQAERGTTSARATARRLRARILARKSARMSVSVSLSVSVPWNSSLRHINRNYCRTLSCFIHMSCLVSTGRLCVRLHVGLNVFAVNCGASSTIAMLIVIYYHRQRQLEKKLHIMHSTPLICWHTRLFMHEK